MPKIRNIHINRLQPIQTTLDLTTIQIYSNLDPKLHKFPLPEIWENDNEYLLADGHHKTYVKYLKNKLIIPIMIHNKKDSNLYSSAYDYALEEIIKRSQKTKKQGIFHIKDLKLS